MVPLPAATSRQDRFGQDEFAGLLATALDRPGAILIAVLVAVGLGAAHALTPGHGKTIVGAYLVGSRGSARHALFLGLTTTVTHTAGVFAFGLLVLFASRFILPEQLYPWLGVLSGLLVVLIGFSLFRAQLRQLLGLRRRGAEHEQVGGYHYHFGVGHSHTPPANDATSWRNLLALGVSGGLLPCPSALVLLLSAIALQRVGFGLVLIVAFSVGLASVLTGIGIVLVYAGRLFERVPVRHGGLARALPLASALFITMAGVAITVQALIQT
jgi:ABC-type nickel/cobalt efflux system permease component RcnA